MSAGEMKVWKQKAEMKLRREREVFERKIQKEAGARYDVSSLFACLNHCLPVSTTVCLSRLLFALN